MENIEIQIASRIASLRENRGWTQEVLSSKAEMSKSQLSRIENLHTSPPLGTISRLARALNVSIEDLIKDEKEESALSIVRKSNQIAIKDVNKLQYQIPFIEKKNRLMEVFLMKIEANRKLTDLMHHKGEECLYVLSGEIKLHYGKTTHILQKGDWAYFKSSTPHRIFGNGTTDAEVLGVITSKDYLYHGSLSHTLMGTINDT
jgi:transcriptional regulator with XRE-family HTH domain